MPKLRPADGTVMEGLDVRQVRPAKDKARPSVKESGRRVMCRACYIPMMRQLTLDQGEEWHCQKCDLRHPIPKSRLEIL